MSEFSRRLRERQSDGAGRRWVYVAYDQLSDGLGPLAREDPRELGIILIESSWRFCRRPYHRQRIALETANGRHFALEQAERGVAVRYVTSDGPFRAALADLAEELGPIRVIEPAERELRVDLAPLVASGAMRVVAHEGWLTTSEQFAASQAGPPWRMDAFYRHVRRASGILMSRGKPEGGKFSFDTENRRAWKGQPPAPACPRFRRDAIKEEACEIVEGTYAGHPGALDVNTLPASRGDIEALWDWVQKACLPHFGPYEDAMSSTSSGLFHSRLSAVINLHRILPRRVVSEAAALRIPLASKEGFVRQILGWREFVHHVHAATDGFRVVGGARTPVRAAPGGGGFEAWSGAVRPAGAGPAELDGGASPSYFGAEGGVPPAYWGRESGLACLDGVVADVWREAYSHHITRLMVLSNIATLLDVSPRDLTDWFWVAYSDAHDWVVEPNVLGMGTYGLGELMTTKPYIAGSAYIRRMSDYCGRCRFRPDVDCPIARLYWAFLSRHAARLRGNQRMFMPLNALRRRAAVLRGGDARVFEETRAALAKGRRIVPEAMPGEVVGDQGASEES